MVRAAVLVKQVPDLRVGHVAVHTDGTIDRSSAPAITNPVDLHAVEAALQLADDVVAISMGPPTAEVALRDAIAMGADRGVLLTDKLLRGSDTWATANALSAVVRHLGEVDLVLAGSSALDGETGQVGPQVATNLDVPQATGCEEVTLRDGVVVVRRVVAGGYERLRMPTPALFTIAETGFRPRYPTFPGRTRARSAVISRLTAADVGLDASRIGLAASPTKVARMEAVPLPSNDTAYVGDGLDYRDLAGIILRSRGRPVSKAVEDEGGFAVPSERVPTTTTPQVLVIAEIDGDGVTDATLELITGAVRLAPGLGGGVGVVVAGHDLDDAFGAVARHGADVVMCADDVALTPYRCQPHARVVHDAIVDVNPQVVLFPATPTGRDLAPRVAAMLDTGLAADCTDLAVGDFRRRGHVYERLLHQVRPAMCGAVLATCVCPEARPQMATVRPGVFAARLDPVRAERRAQRVVLRPEDEVVEVIDRQVATGDVGLESADVIVAGGAGCGRGNWHMVEELAAELGGGVAASRGAVEAQLAPRSTQVGQTGMTVHPSVYIACGISGALQHVVGMQGSGTVVAVNRDPDAPIFRFAHYGIVDEVEQSLPRLTAALRAARAPA
jgi:electron transfer flavoprotein alpha subunit